MITSLSLVFNFLLTVLLGLEHCHWRLALSVFGITTGVAMASYSSASFHAFGFACALGAACMAALRWSITQRLLGSIEAETGSRDPLVLL